jgi:hypothetical protein
VAKFLVISRATAELTVDANNPLDALRGWRAFHERHPYFSQGPLTIVLRRDDPAILDEDGTRCTPDGPPDAARDATKGGKTGRKSSSGRNAADGLLGPLA